MTSPGTNPFPTPRKAQPPARDRRRRGRHRTYTAAFTGMNGNSTGIALDLYEILNLSEDGMCFQSASQMEPGETLNLCLDLCDPKTYIHTSGRVTWSDGLGRTGIRFQKMPEGDIHQLREWLLANALAQAAEIQASQTAAANQSAPMAQPPENTNVLLDDVDTPALSSLELEPNVVVGPVEEVRREVESIAFDLDEALRIIAERTLTLTRSSGAAIALSSGEDMVCRATAGSDAPGLGASLHVGSGFSGECVRSDQLLYCEDAESDTRVDRESCRGLGIRSIIAAPIRSGGGVIGLLEVFASQPRGFGEDDKVALDAMTLVIGRMVRRATQAIIVPACRPNTTAPQRPSPVNQDPTSNSETAGAATPPEPEGPLTSTLRRIFLLTGLTLLIGVSLWARWEGMGARAGASNRGISGASALRSMREGASTGGVAGMDFNAQREFAQQGDAAAQFSMGVRYATGEGVTQDYSEAARWFQLAGEQGHVMAQSTLGAYYWAGRGVPEDLSKAYFWAVLAKAGGDEASKMRLSFLAFRISRKELRGVEQQAKDWLRRHETPVESSRAQP